LTRAVLDYTATWTGTREAPLGYEWVCGEIARILKRYGLNTVVGDQHCASIIQQEFLKLGIRYQEVTFGAGTRLDLFGNLKHLFIQRKIQILDKPELLRQLLGLEEHKTTRGNIEIRSAYGVKDDLAVAVGLVAHQLSNIDEGPTPFLMGRVARPWDGVRIRPYDLWAPESRHSLNLDRDPALVFSRPFATTFHIAWTKVIVWASKITEGLNKFDISLLLIGDRSIANTSKNFPVSRVGLFL